MAVFGEMECDFQYGVCRKTKNFTMDLNTFWAFVGKAAGSKLIQVPVC